VNYSFNVLGLDLLCCWCWSCSRSRQGELGEVEGFRETAGLVYNKQWTRLVKCWASNLIGCGISRGQ